MAVELESTIMDKIGLGQHYNYFNGSGSCQYIAQKAIDSLPGIAKGHNLTISPAWLAHCRKAWRVDRVDGKQYTLTNVWIACSYAIQDAIYRSWGDKGFDPIEDWYFFTDEARREWEAQENRVHDERHFPGSLHDKLGGKGWPKW